LLIDQYEQEKCVTDVAAECKYVAL